jgi:ABC-type transporter Mla subunit MlaD
MARSRTPQDALRDAVERTVHASDMTRTRAQGAVDDLGRAANRLRKQLEGSRPATQDDVKALRKELRAIAKRLDRIEDLLPKKGK